MALRLDLLHSTLDAAINARRTLDLLDVSSAIGGVTKSNCKIAKSIDTYAGASDAKLLAALFLISDASKVEAELPKCRADYSPNLYGDCAGRALYHIQETKVSTRADGLRMLAEVLCEIPSVLLLRIFTKDELIALRDLIGFASISGIIDDPDASVSSVSENMKVVEHSHDADGEPPEFEPH